MNEQYEIFEQMISDIISNNKFNIGCVKTNSLYGMTVAVLKDPEDLALSSKKITYVRLWITLTKEFVDDHDLADEGDYKRLKALIKNEIIKGFDFDKCEHTDDSIIHEYVIYRNFSSIDKGEKRLSEKNKEP